MKYILHFTPQTFLVWTLDEFGNIQVNVVKLDDE
jgi:hypothetical protein